METPTTFTIDDITKMITAIRGDNHNTKKHALSNLHNIAKALGPERTRDELIPYTVEAADYDDEEYAKIAESFGHMLPFIGGEDEISILLQPLRYICENEDTNVRDPAVNALVSLTKAASENTRTSKITPLIKGIATDGWYALRCAAAAFVCRSLSLFSATEQDAYLVLLGTLATDSTILVRKTLSQELPSFLNYHIKPKTKQFESLLQIINTLARDEAPAISIELPAALAALPNQGHEGFALEISRLLFSGTWQSRAALLTGLPAIFPVKSTPPKDFLKEVAQKAILDTQVEVKTASARLIPYFYECEIFKNDEFASYVNGIISDQTDFVRQAAAKALGQIKNTAPIKSLLENALGQLMADVVMDVKVAALTSIVTTGAGVAAAKQTADLVKFSGWRTKKAVASALLLVSGKISSSEFDNGFLSLLVSLLGDEAADVRKTALDVAEQLSKSYGVQWRDSSLVPAIDKFSKNNDYLLRETAAAAIVKLSICDKCASILDSLAVDKVPNVRMVVARELPDGHPILAKLKNDTDPDVAFFAKRA